MTHKLEHFILYFMLLMNVTSCSKPLPDSMPNLAREIDNTTLNTSIKVSIQKGVNSFKLDDTIQLSIDNLSDKFWYLSITEDILIFRYENDQWIEVQDKTTTLGGTEFMLDAAGNFPKDIMMVSIAPDLNLDNPVALRIFVFAHDEFGENSTGAFIDVYLKP